MANSRSRPEANPCRFCDHREVGCHGSCPEYRAFAERRAEQRQADHAAAERVTDLSAYQAAFRRRIGIHRRRR